MERMMWADGGGFEEGEAGSCGFGGGGEGVEGGREWEGGLARAMAQKGQDGLGGGGEGIWCVFKWVFGGGREGGKSREKIQVLIERLEHLLCRWRFLAAV